MTKYIYITAENIDGYLFMPLISSCLYMDNYSVYIRIAEQYNSNFKTIKNNFKMHIMVNNEDGWAIEDEVYEKCNIIGDGITIIKDIKSYNYIIKFEAVLKKKATEHNE